jgi:phosphatidylethanolamine/phosphatidyl-N-methylethanolamine N-methyltransferase
LNDVDCNLLPGFFGAKRRAVHLTTFAMQALADFRTVGAVAPSSRYLTQAMVSPLPLRRARVVVELGCGTGAVTRALLNEMPRQSTLLAFEINPRFSQCLQQSTSDPRLQVITTSAENIREEVHRRGFKHVDAVASSLALTLMSDQLKHDILSESGGVLHRSGVFTQYLYLHGIQWQGGKPGLFAGGRMLRRHFRDVQKTIVWPNLPPAFVYACRGAR